MSLNLRMTSGGVLIIPRTTSVTYSAAVRDAAEEKYLSILGSAPFFLISSSHKGWMRGS